MHDIEAAPPPLHPFHDHNPWHTHDDPDEDDISNVRWRQLGPGRYAVSATRTISPRPGGGIDASTALGPFAGLLNTIIGGATGMAAASNQGTRASPEGTEERTGASGMGSGITPGGHRFTYTSNARLEPRNADGGPQVHPQDELNK
jgi:E3 ubiquitin-protein ligase RNF115/126